jgi:hypothetical protein
MKLQTLLLVAFSFTSLVLSCKKDKDDTGNVTANKIHGRWNIDSLVINEHINGNSDMVTHAGTSADYIDFRSDGTMITYFEGATDNSNYEVQSDSVIVFSGDSAYILELTENKFVFYTRADAGSLGYIEITYYLTR